MLWDVAIRSLWQRRGRALLTILGVATILATYVATTSGLGSHEESLDARLSGLAGRVYVQQPVEGYAGGGSFPALSSSLPEETATEILALGSLDREASSAILFVPLARIATPGEPPAALAVGIEMGHEPAFLGTIAAEEGQAALPNAGSVILGQRAARTYAGADGTPAAVGQTIEIAGQPFEVAGILEPALQLIDHAVLIDLPTAQALFNRPGTVSAVILTAESVAGAGALQETTMAQFPHLQMIAQDSIVESATEVEAGVEALIQGINGTIVAVAVILITIVTLISAMEQRREIGTLQAIGASRRAIASLVVGQSVVVSLLSTLLAWPLFALAMLALRDHFAALNISLTAADLTPNWAHMGAVALLIGLLASLWPVWQATRVEPLEVLRYE